MTIRRNIIYRSIFFILSVATSLNGQESIIDKIEIVSKQNGISINIYSDIKIQTSQITGWYNASTAWSYITIYNAKGDTLSLNSTPKVDSVTDLEIIQLEESLQLGLRSINPVEQFEFYHDNSSSTITASLRYPISKVLTYIENNNIEKQKRQMTLKSLIINNKTALYFITTIAIIGLLVN